VLGACALLACASATGAGTQGPEISLHVDGRADAVVAHVAIGPLGGHPGHARLVLQQRLTTRHGSAWRDRASRPIGALQHRTRLVMRWRHPPGHRTLMVRIALTRDGRLVAHSRGRTVRAGDPGTVFYSGECNAGAGDVEFATWRLVAGGGGFCIFQNHYDGLWTGSSRCDASRAAAFPTTIHTLKITQLAGYSLGRLGPLYFLRSTHDHDPGRWDDIDYILLLDPGSDDLSGSCDADATVDADGLLRAWLDKRSSNKLVIMSGPLTAAGSPDHAGIRKYYLAQLTADQLAHQVFVCDVTRGHDEFMRGVGGYGWMVGSPPPVSCPGNRRLTFPAEGRRPDGGGSGSQTPGPGAGASVHLAQGPPAVAGYHYAITLSGFQANSDVTVSCRDSADPGGFISFALHTDAAGSGSTQTGCYSGDGPDHWVVAGGVESNHVAWSTGSVQPPARVAAYDNYGSANAGHAMCRGNPARPESMPGGTTSQTFTVPAGVAALDSARVQIDPDASVTAHAALYVDGALRATANAAAGGDTSFSFTSTAVAAGSHVTLSIAFTATFGKIITVYTAGSPGGTFTASNSCSDGAPSLTTTATGLRAVVSGWTG
jgi:hypothetical protein